MTDSAYPLPPCLTIPLEWTRDETDCGHEYHTGTLPDGTIAATIEQVDGRTVTHGPLADFLSIDGA